MALDFDSQSTSMAAEEAIADLEKGQEDSAAMRASERLEIRIKVTAHPGNVSDADDRPKQVGITGDVSSGGCLAIFRRPGLVGDVYRLEFEETEHAFPTVFARCVRCRLIHDTAFEVAFRFFESIGSRAKGARPAQGLLD